MRSSTAENRADARALADDPDPATARVPIVAAVNTAIVRAAIDLKDVRVLRMDLLFTPQGYRENMRYRGRDVRVREGDGIHLNVAAPRSPRRAVAQALRDTTGALGRNRLMTDVERAPGAGARHCTACARSGAQEHLDRIALVHRAIGIRGVVERQLEIEDLAGSILRLKIRSINSGMELAEVDSRHGVLGA